MFGPDDVQGERYRPESGPGGPYGEGGEPGRYRVRRIYGVQLRFGQDRITGRMIFGLIVITLGVLWTLDNLNILDSGAILRWWPALLVAFGIGRLTGIGCRRSVVAGTIFTSIGALLLLERLHLFDFDAWRLWPLFMIVIGVSLVARSFRNQAPVPGGPDPTARLNTFVMMGGIKKQVTSQEFRGGEASAVMGGVVLDLRGAKAAGPEVVIDVFTWWGGIDILVPPDWRVVSDVLPIMGGVEDRTRRPDGVPTTTLVLKGGAVMGGVEIKN